MIVTRVDLADIFGVAKTTVDRWVRDGCPVLEKNGKGKPSKYDTREVYSWLMAGGEQHDLEKERARLTARQAEKTEIQIAEMKGELVDSEDVKRAWVKEVAACRAKLLSIPSKIAGEIVSKENLQEVQELLKQSINEALMELAGN